MKPLIHLTGLVSRLFIIIVPTVLTACVSISPATPMEFTGSMNFPENATISCRVDLTASNPNDAVNIQPQVSIQGAFSSAGKELQGQTMEYRELAPGETQTLVAIAHGISCKNLTKIVFRAKDGLTFSESSAHEIKFK